MISYCGLDCEHCDAFVATKTADARLKARVARDWSAIYERQIDPREVSCRGCTCVGTHGIYCDTMCRVKPCCREKGLDHCGLCPEFPCEKLRIIFDFDPGAEGRLRKAAGHQTKAAGHQTKAAGHQSKVAGKGGGKA